MEPEKVGNIRTIKTMGGIALIMVIFIVELLFFIWCREKCNEVGIEIAAATDRQQELLATHQSLNVELASLKAPGRIYRYAKDKLGLTTPLPEQVVIIK
ncbi:cell division protein FtsL [Desulfobacterales bacterium HSG16]|nr:cell division protein FtsL [Desulfobacterales bacterium HSG16]